MIYFFDEDHVQNRQTRCLSLDIEGQELSLSDAIDGLERVLARLRAEAGSLEEEFNYRFASVAHASFTYPYERFFHITGLPSRQYRYAPPDAALRVVSRSKSSSSELRVSPSHSAGGAGWPK